MLSLVCVLYTESMATESPSAITEEQSKVLEEKVQKRDLSEIMNALCNLIEQSKGDPLVMRQILESFPEIFNPKNYDPPASNDIFKTYNKLAEFLLKNGLDPDKENYMKNLTATERDGICRFFVSFTTTGSILGLFGVTPPRIIVIPHVVRLAFLCSEIIFSHRADLKTLQSALAENPRIFANLERAFRGISGANGFSDPNRSRMTLLQSIEKSGVLDFPSGNFPDNFVGKLFVFLSAQQDPHLISHTLSQRVFKNLEDAYKNIFDPTIIFGEESPSYKETSPSMRDKLFPVNKLPAEALMLFNNKDYINDFERLPKGVILGEPLTGEIGKAPIGYNILIPDGPIKGIVVVVYGGVQEEMRKEKAFRPAQSEFLNVFNNAGFACITLNLPDLLNLKVHQLEMPYKLFNLIQACIHDFWEVITNNPAQLSSQPEVKEKLERLKGVPAWLFGKSFGGLMAVRHAEKYPNTFKGYIASDAVLSTSMLALSELHASEDKAYSLEEAKKLGKPHLSPDLYIKTLKDPLLLLHNMDDNNVNSKVTFYFYDKARNANKDVSLYITREGSPIPKMGDIIATWDKGHSIPVGKAFDDYMRAILMFMRPQEEKEDGLSKIISDWRFHRFNPQANINYRMANFDDRCLGELFETYRKTKGKFTDEAWDSTYEPIVKALYHADFLYALPKDSEVHEEEYQRLANLGDDPWKNAVSRHLRHFLRFMEEYLDVPLLDVSETGEDIKDTLVAGLINAFKKKFNEALRDPNMLGASFYLNQFYLANPDQVDTTLYTQKQKGELEEALPRIKEEFNKMIKEYRQKTGRVLRESFIKAAKNPEIVKKYGNPEMAEKYRKFLEEKK